MAALPISTTGAQAAQCANPARDGSPTATGVVNTYYPGNGSVAVGATSINIGAASGTTAIAAGDLILIIQMQDSTINATNTGAYGDGSAGDPARGVTAVNQSGVFEFARAASSVALGGGTLTLVGESGGGLVNAYTNAAATATQGQRRFQVIRVPQYDTASVGAGLTAARWNGTTGGVAAIDVARTLNFASGTINVAGLGFRGGGGRSAASGSGAPTDYRTPTTNTANGAKGEGTAGTPRYLNDNGALLDNVAEGYPNGSNGRGAPGNAGGGGTDGDPGTNSQNTGGGGGAGGAIGGKGGDAWCPAGTGCAQTGGFGGAATAGMGAARLTLGGGGGAGSTNDGTGTPAAGFASSGAAGGGIVILRAGVMTGAGTINADGAAANSTVNNDGSGGGGGGGSVLLIAGSTTGLALSVTARGGNGGTNAGGGTPHGPGGGGGGGYVATSFTFIPTLTGGTNGTTAGSIAYGSVSGTGATGATATATAVRGMSSGAECTPVLVKSFSPATIAAGGVSRLNLTVTNPNPNQTLSGFAFTDAYPANLFNTTTPGATAGCGGTVTAAANGTSVAQAAGTLAANSSCSISVSVTSSTVGALTNTIAAGGLTGTLGGSTVATLAPATAVLTVTAPLTATKSSVVVSDPVNGTTNPKAIPDATVDYTIAVNNPTSLVLDANTVALGDPLPAQFALSVADLGGAGSGPVIFTEGAPPSGLTYTFTSLASTTDSLDFSNDGGATWAYVPVADANGLDLAVTNIRIRPGGPQAANSVWSIRFRGRVR